MTTTSSESIRFHVLKPPPEEQVFSNPLLMHLILRNLGTQDNLRAALVSKAWCANSRDFLKSKSCRIPMCVRVKYETPCRKLAELNEFLKTTSSSITFNGIHYISVKYPSWRGHYSCPNCLFSQTPTFNTKLFQKEILQLYGQILKKMKFKYILMKDCLHLDYCCPSTRFIKFILANRRTEIVELDYTDYRFAGLMSYGNRGRNRLYPNLKVFGMELGPNNLYQRSGFAFPIKAPSLQRITQFAYNPSNHWHSRIKNFPYPAVTVLGDVIDHGLNPDPESVQAALKFVTDFRPKINGLYFWDDHPSFVGVDGTLSKQHRSDLFELGCLISPHIKILECGVLTFTSPTSSSDESSFIEENMTHFRRSFPNLEALKLSGSMGVDFLDCLNGMGYDKEFPKLQEVEIDLEHSRYIFYGPVNRITVCRFEGVETLTLSRSPDFLLSKLGLLQRFSNVRFLNLVDLGLTCDAADSRFAQTINAIEDLPFLEEIHFNPNIPALSQLNLDHLFQEEDLGNDAIAASGQTRTLFKPLVLANTRLRKIKISYQMCWPLGKNSERAYAQPGRFVVSNRIAEWIKQHCPGFSISVKITKRCLSGCSCPLPSSFAAFLEHVKPLASVLFEDGPSYNDYYLHLKF